LTVCTKLRPVKQFALFFKSVGDQVPHTPFRRCTAQCGAAAAPRAMRDNRRERRAPGLTRLRVGRNLGGGRGKGLLPKRRLLPKSAINSKPVAGTTVFDGSNVRASLWSTTPESFPRSFRLFQKGVVIYPHECNSALDKVAFTLHRISRASVMT
jgi:hypothetical protein